MSWLPQATLLSGGGRREEVGEGVCVWVGCQKSQNMLLFPLRSAVPTRPFAERTNSRGGTQTHTSPPKKESLSFCQRRNPSQSSSPLCSSSYSLNTHTQRFQKLCCFDFMPASFQPFFWRGKKKRTRDTVVVSPPLPPPPCILLFPSSPRLPPTLPSTPKEVTRPA